eukprot:380265_1
MISLLLFLTLLSLLGCLLFITRFHESRILINSTAVLLLIFIDIILPDIIWSNRNLSNCTAMHLTTSIYIFIITYKLLEILKSPIDFFKRHNITKIWQVFICLITPSQINFISVEDYNKFKYKYQTRKECIPKLIETFIIIPIISFICVNIILYFKLFDSSNPYSLYWQWFFYIFWALSFVAQQLLNFLSCIIALIFGNYIQIKYSYNWPLFNSYSPRSMWKNWSVVVAESLKYLIYIPFGGNKNPFISVPCVFIFNCIMHFYFTWLLHKQLAIFVNTNVFLIFAIAVYSQIMAERCTSKDIQNNILWKMFWFLILYVSVITAVIVGFGVFFVPAWDDFFNIYGIF